MLLLVAAGALALPASAFAKGASEASIQGPGLGKTVITGNGETSGDKLGNLGQAAGFFPAVFSQSPDPMTNERPAGKLRARYRIVWTVPGPNGESKISQDAYPYAQPQPVTYMKPGQVFWDGQHTRGGWYVGDSQLSASLFAVGVPKSMASADSFDWVKWTWIGAAGAALLLALAFALTRARRLRPEPAV
ncbi:MAG: hypothetical protein ABI948_12400 [Thermoleophilia bacterium]